MSVNTVVNIIPVVSSARSSLHYNAHQPIRTPLLLHVGAHLCLQTSSLRFEFCAIPALQEFFQGQSNREQRAVIWLSFHSHWESRVWMSGSSFEPACLLRIHQIAFQLSLAKIHEYFGQAEGGTF